MASISFQQLIDLAIGSPEPGHVNFVALHCVLISFAEKLNLISTTVDCSKFGNFSNLASCSRHSNTVYGKSKTSIVSRGSKSRFPGGADDPEETEAAAAPGEETEPSPDAAAPAAEEVVVAEETAEAGPNATEEQTERISQEKVETVEEALAPAAVAEETEEAGPQMAAEESASKLEGQQSAVGSPAEKPGSAEVLRTSIENLEKRLSQVEVVTEVAPFSPEYTHGVKVMKDQLELVMDQLLKLTSLSIDKKISPQTYEQLRGMSEKLRTIQKQNVFIEGAGVSHVAEEHASHRSEFGEEEEYIEDGMQVTSQMSVRGIDGDGAPSGAADDPYQLGLHLCYTPEKMLDQMLQMKTEFCLLTNKVNEISASILEQDCQRTTLILQELQDAMRDVKYTTASLREALVDRIETRVARNIENIDEMTKALAELSREKIDRNEIEVMLADKVDYNQLQRKVSHEQMQEMRCQLEKEFCEMDRIIKHNERSLLQAMANLQSTIGLDTFNDLLNRFKGDMSTEVQKVDQKLDTYIKATNDDCAAAGARVKVLQDLACISCDTTCVMRTVEKAHVAKLPDAHATNALAPLITYEMGNIRKSGIMGYHRKDEFPHAPHAWMNRQAVNLKACVPRHAGGHHTTYTAKERVEKVLFNKK